MEGTPLVSCQSMRFEVGKSMVKFMGLLKSHNSQNPIKHKDINLKILGSMVLDIIRIISQNSYENKSIIMNTNHQPLKGEKG